MATATECPRGFARLAAGSSLLLFAGLVLYAWWDPAGFAAHLVKDGEPVEEGTVEHLTVIVLIPGILAGLYAFAAYRHRLPHPLLACWLLVWSLACIYFAGEEASWGQWYFHWETQETLARLNDQGETNLHNMSSWLDQKPRVLVEIFVFVAGFLIPLRRALGRRDPIVRQAPFPAWERWLYAPTALLPAAALFVVIRLADWFAPQGFESFGQSELRELAIAWFLSWYLASYAARLAPRPVVGQDREGAGGDGIQA